MDQTGGTLVAHCGAERISREQLRLIEPPPATATYLPVKHAELVDELEEGLHRRNLTIIREQYAVQTEGLKFFAVLDLSSENGVFRTSLGLRTSNDKSFRISLVCGANVFVCDNLCFSGESVLLARKHTSGLRLDKEVDNALITFEQQNCNFQRQIEDLHQRYVSNDEAKRIMFDAVVTRDLMPVRLLPKVAEEYFHPKHPEFKGRDLWSLSNSFTEVSKELNEGPRFRTLQGLGRFFSELLN